MALIQRIPAGDLALEHGDLVWIDGIRHRRQQLATRFRFIKGEWFRDLLAGVPYFDAVFVKAPNLDVIRGVFRGVLIQSPGTRSITRFDLAPDYQERVLAFAFEVVTDAGVLTVDELDEDFRIPFPVVA